MDTNVLKKFAQAARNLLIDQVRSKFDLVLDPDSAAWREHPQTMKELDAAVAKEGMTQIIEKVAYTWFNRFTALRFMDANRYTSVGVVSPAKGQTRPEILADAMAGSLPDGAPASIASLLDGRTPSSDSQGEAYRLLLVHACNQWHGVMPFLFERIDDYTELLIPEDLLSQSSLLAELRAVMTEDACEDVEIIGWLYQFYISEKKDQVSAGARNGKKIAAENIPAATQLFTPHWVVRYLVENSLGRLWLLNRPHSRLAERMEYYIAPEEPETDFLHIARPEEIRICDPAAGSGHMLTYAFDLLYAIYEEEGYNPIEIPPLILTHNLTGMEIDDRAGALAAFALAMKAMAKMGRRRFMQMDAKPDIRVFQNLNFTHAEMSDVAAMVGKNQLTGELRETFGQFEQGKNLGSLIVPKLPDPTRALRDVKAQDVGCDLLLGDLQERVVGVLRMAEALSQRYHVVVANPPYKLKRDLNNDLAKYLDNNYPQSKTDLYSAFIDRSVHLVKRLGYNALVTMESWMFLASYEKLRQSILSDHSILGLTHMPYLGKGGTPMGISFGTDAKIIQTFQKHNVPATFLCVRYFETDDKMIPTQFPTSNERLSVRYSREFKDIPGSPIAYWVEQDLLSVFRENRQFSEKFYAKQGIATGENERFLRQWHEINAKDLDVHQKGYNSFTGQVKWYPYSKGGEARRWYGNHFLVINWAKNGSEIKNFRDSKGKLRSGLTNLEFQFKEGVTWSLTSSSDISFCARFRPAGFMFDVNGMSAFPKEDCVPRLYSTALLNSYVPQQALKFINPTMAFQSGDISRIPLPEKNTSDVELGPAENCISLSIADWDAYETSWDFAKLPLLSIDHRGKSLEDSYVNLRTHWRSITDEMQRLEAENNRIFLGAYGLQDKITLKDVPIEEITLTCNPAYRYGVKDSVDSREVRLRVDTIAEFLSYAVGCMFGRYSLEAPGLILANQGETLEDYLARVPTPIFKPSADNVIPVLDGDWFVDDICERFRLFLRVTFGTAQFRENLHYIENALGKDIRKYFIKDFYGDHVKRYKKRPIYWMFSSPKGTFNALIYMHRYRPDTVSVLLNDYLREFISKLEAERGRLGKLTDDPNASQRQRTGALRETAVIARQIDELNSWERDAVFPLAQAKTEIDLDDGVKVNYSKFGAALKKIPGVDS